MPVLEQLQTLYLSTKSIQNFYDLSCFKRMRAKRYHNFFLVYLLFSMKKAKQGKAHFNELVSKVIETNKNNPDSASINIFFLSFLFMLFDALHI